MNLKRLFFIMTVSLLTTLALPVLAQTRTVTGKITDSGNNALPHATVTVKGTNFITQTAADGTFTLQNVPASAKTLTITYVGFATQEVAIGTGAIAVHLLTSSTVQADVVVQVGYGTLRKKDVTGAVTTVTEKDFNKGVITTPEQLIQGKVAGVVVTPNSGQPGIGSTIRIRGGSSLNGSNDPLIVIDGVPLPPVGTTINGAPNPLSLINPNDIETFTVLKDASATAIYGNRASNGVIIITTKKGRRGKLKVTFSTVNALSTIAKEVSVLTGDQVRSTLASMGTPAAMAQLALAGTANTDWQKQIYQNALSSDNNISISGGIKGLPYRLALDYLGQEGVLKTGSLQRTSATLNISPSFFNNSLKVDINLKDAYAQNRFANSGAIGDAIRMDPTQSAADTFSAYSKYGGYFEWTSGAVPNGLATRNPLAELYAKNDISTVNRTIDNIQLDYKMPFLPALRAVVNGGIDLSTSNGSTTVAPYSAIGYANGGSYDSYTQYNRNELFDFYFNYVKDLKKIKSHIDATAGTEYQDFYRATPALTTYSILDSSLSTGKVPPPVTGLPDSTENKLLSFYGRVNYSFEDKYILTATFRRDASSRFASDNHWGNFPSAAFAWRINKEGFFNSAKIISDLKLRVGYGVTGNQDIPGAYYGYTSTYAQSTSQAGYGFGNTYYNTYRGSAYYPALQWESTTTADIGLDYGLWNNRITGTFDYYSRKTSNLIATNFLIPALSNLSNAVPVANAGDLTSSGVEFGINAGVIQNKAKDLSWDLGFNIAYNTYEITSLGALTGSGEPTGGIVGGTGNDVEINAVGHTRNVFYLQKQVYNSNGTPIEGVYADVNKSTSNLQYYGKSPDPKVTLGFNSSLNYKDWVFSFSMHGSIGNYDYNNVNSNDGAYNTTLLSSTGSIANATTNVLKTNFYTNQYFSDYYLENASFLRMDNIVVGRNFSKVVKNGNLRVSAIVQNPFIITKYTGQDPELDFGTDPGIDKNIYPKTRTYSLAISLDL